MVEGRAGSPSIFIIGFSSEAIELKQPKLKFLSGLGFAISVAVFDFEEDSEDEKDPNSEELDRKKFAPARPLTTTPIMSAGSLQGMNPSISATELGLGVWGKNISEVNLAHLNGSTGTLSITPRSPRRNGSGDEVVSNYTPRRNTSGDDVGLPMLDSPYTAQAHAVHVRFNDKPQVLSAAEPVSPSPPTSNKYPLSPQPGIGAVGIFPMNAIKPEREAEKDEEDEESTVIQPANDIERPFSPETGLKYDLSLKPSTSNTILKQDDGDSGKGDSDRSNGSSQLSTCIPPTWEPTAEFSYPVANIPPKHFLHDDLGLEHFSEVRHLADGSNANIFLAKFEGETVIIKMIKEAVQTDPVSVHEFDVEHGILCRLSHPNIIKLKGAGRWPRRFIVLEYLGGGSLNTMLTQNEAKSGLASRLFRKPTFTYINLLLKARDIADAFDYIHSKCHEGACILHRGERSSSS